MSKAHDFPNQARFPYVKPRKFFFLRLQDKPLEVLYTP